MSEDQWGYLELLQLHANRQTKEQLPVAVLLKVIHFLHEIVS